MHINEDYCSSCTQILNRYPLLNEELRTWFLALRIEHPDLHVSCAGRGRVDQEVAFERGASKAHYGESAHSYNCALDVFQLKDGKALWDKAWFQEVIAPHIYPALTWYGDPKAVYYELPHIEIANWKDLVKRDLVFLVET